MKKIFLSLTLLMFLGLAAMAQESTQITQDPNAPIMSFETTDYDYGVMYQNGDGKAIFVYTNEGKVPLIISRVKSSCGCTVPKWSRQPLLSGESDTIKVKYDSKRLGSFHKSITITSNASTKTIVLKIKGKVVPEPSDAMPTKNIDSDMSPINK